MSKLSTLVFRAFEDDVYFVDSSDEEASNILGFVGAQEYPYDDAVIEFEKIKESNVLFLINEEKRTVLFAPRGAVEAYQQRRREGRDQNNLRLI